MCLPFLQMNLIPLRFYRILSSLVKSITQFIWLRNKLTTAGRSNEMGILRLKQTITAEPERGGQFNGHILLKLPI